MAIVAREEVTAPTTLEDSIYAFGFPSRADERRLEDFHRLENWNERLDLATTFESRYLRQLANRLAWLHASHGLPDTLRAAMTVLYHGRALGEDTTVPWGTFAKADTALATIDDDAAAARIASWLADRRSAAGQALLAATPPPVIASGG